MSIASIARPLSIFASIILLTASGFSTAAEGKVVKGEVVSVDRTTNTAVIHPEKGNPFTIEVPEKVVKAGIRPSRTELKEGQLVTLKYASK